MISRCCCKACRPISFRSPFIRPHRSERRCFSITPPASSSAPSS
jgi:hypothetical protein